jgi:Na+-transporting NADH:ubiquinone oxidoreductase subunit F
MKTGIQCVSAIDQLKRLKTKRRISFWHGARSMREASCVEEFNQLQADNPNFTWTLALSDPLPEDCEFYMCCPPMMNASVIKMLTNLGVDRENAMPNEYQEDGAIRRLPHG